MKADFQALRGRVRAQASELIKAGERPFFELLRQSDLPYLAGLTQGQPGLLYRLSFDALYLLARRCLTSTIAQTMHQYIYSSLAAVSPLLDKTRGTRLIALLQDMHRRRQLLGIGEFGDHLQKKNRGGPDRLRIEPSQQGGFVVSGKRNLVSLSQAADRLVLAGHLKEKLCLFVVNLKDHPGVSFAEPVLAPVMAGTQTRPLTLEKAAFPTEALICDKEDLSVFLCTYTTAWFQGLISATYLGAAAAALDEVRAFGHQAKLPDGSKLAQADGFRVDYARLVIRVRSAVAQSYSLSQALECLHDLGLQADKQLLSQAMDEMVEVASLLKYQATTTAQEVVLACRKLIGTSTLRAGHPFESLAAVISVAPLHPIISARFERTMADDHLGSEPFVGLFHS